ncbi:MAG TPA: glycosyltransferase family 1 protein [Anaerolineae bacterium]|nr:glycosyltransferase family 1 protein [Anaerolineae bacterium]
MRDAYGWTMPYYRILMLAPTGFFADYGCHVRIRGQALALRDRGHDVHLCTYPGGRDVPGLPTIRPPLLPKGREMPVGSSWRKVGLDLWLTPTAWAATLRLRPDILHAYLHEGALIAAVIRRLPRPLGWRVPVVFDFQGSLTAEMLDHRFISHRSPFLPPLRWLERWIDHQPDAILASSSLATHLLADHFSVPAEHITHLPDSVDPEVFRPPTSSDEAALMALRQRLGLPNNRPLVVYLGLLAPYQGTDLLLQTIAHMAASSAEPMPHFLIMGFPDVEHYRNQAAALGVAAYVTFTGAIPYEEAPHYLALGDVAVAPKLSATEGSGKLLTYMAVGLPVVATDTFVHREYLGELGIYARPGDAAAFAEALQRALADLPDSSARGQALRDVVVHRYTWDHAARQIESVYAHLLGQRS